MDTNKLIFNACIIAIIILSFVLGIVIGDILKNLNSYNFANGYNYSNGVINCSNLSLVEFSYCAREYINTFYNYTVRNETNYTNDQGTFEDIVNNGGDCYDYTQIYEELFTNNGFLTKQVSIKTKNNGHRFLIAWDSNFTSYCKIDLLDVVCSKFS